MTMSPRARSAIAVIALLVAGLLAGCEDQEDPPEPTESSSESAPPSTSTTTEPTPAGPVAPSVPEQAEAETKAGAMAFIEYFWDVVTYARRTGDVRALRGLSDPACAGCSGAIESITRVYNRGGHIDGGEYHVVSASPGRTPSGFWNVSARVRVERSRTTGAGDLDQVVRAGTIDFLFGLEHEDGAWRTTFLDAP